MRFCPLITKVIANLVTAGVRLISGQTDWRLRSRASESGALTDARARNATIDDLGSSAFMIDLLQWRMKLNI